MPTTPDQEGSGRAPFRVLQITDCHLFASPEGTLRDVCTLDTLTAVMDQARSQAAPDAILATGDLAQEPAPGTYRLFLDTLRARFDAPLLCTPGNHDSEPLFSGELPVAPLALGDWLLVGVDTHIEGETGGRVGAAERRRLRERIGGAGEHVLVAGHHSPTRIGVDWLDQHRIEDGAELLECLGERARAYVFGHIHQPVESSRRGVRLLGTPSTCFQFTSGAGFGVDDRPPGYRWLTLAADGTVAAEVHWLAG